MGDQRDAMGEQEGDITMPVGPLRKRILAESSEGSEELLPRILDSITLTHIAPKLPWRAVRILSQVSPAWQRAVHSHEVYKARICARSIETFYVLCHTLPQDVRLGDNESDRVHAISLYSVEDQRCYQLPTIPGLNRGIPRFCQCITLDGRIYILGGEVESYCDYSGCKEVYELDVAGKWEWKRRADMQHGRSHFACAIKDEQIYVFGGKSDCRTLRDFEAYDPKTNRWSSIVPMMISRVSHQVTALGEVLVVHGGHIYPAAPSRKLANLEVYHPGRNEVRELEHHSSWTAGNHVEAVFLANGKLHMIISDRIYVLDIGIDKYTLTDLRSSLYEELGPLVPDKTLDQTEMFGARVVSNGELLALVYCYTHEAGGCNIVLLQSKGLGSENSDLLWERAVCSLCFEHLTTAFICPIEL